MLSLYHYKIFYFAVNKKRIKHIFKKFPPEIETLVFLFKRMFSISECKWGCKSLEKSPEIFLIIGCRTLPHGQRYDHILESPYLASKSLFLW